MVIDRFFSMFSKDMAIDLGTANISICKRRRRNIK